MCILIVATGHGGDGLRVLRGPSHGRGSFLGGAKKICEEDGVRVGLTVKGTGH